MLIQKGGCERAVTLPCLNSSLVGEQRQAFSHAVEKSCHGEITHSSEETHPFTAEVNHECRNSREWRLGWCFLLKVECNWLSGEEEGTAATCFYYRAWVAAICVLGGKWRKGTLKASGMLCALSLVDGKQANLENGSIFLLVPWTQGHNALQWSLRRLPSNGQRREQTNTVSAPGLPVTRDSAATETLTWKEMQRFCSQV